MIKLNINDRKKLTKVMETISLLQTYRGRKQLLELSGLGFVSSHIDLEGSPFVVINELIVYLEEYGKISYENEALGILLNSIKEFVSEPDEKFKFIDYILSKYNLMTPVIKSYESVDWKDQANTDEVKEKIIGENTLRNISFLKRGFEVSGSVSYLDVANKWTGTGVMISSNLLMTNQHVVPSQGYLKGLRIHFNYQLTFDGLEEKIAVYKPKKDGIFYSNKELDFTILELQEPAGNDWGISSFGEYLIQKNSRINIIQHPGGLPKKISFQNNLVVYSDLKVVQYVTSTLCGSSGSPVYDDQWKIIAIHHSGGFLFEPLSKKRFLRNEGISSVAILNDIPSSIKNKINIQIKH
jgi:hypothetical protein